jgi:MSHA biogenesis protein MshO
MRTPLAIPNTHCLPRQQGFTLVELVFVLIIISIVGVGISSFMRATVLQYSEFVTRSKLLSDSSFIVERMSREITHAIPNSIRIKGNANAHCIEFVPNKWATTYTKLPMQPSTDTEIDVIRMEDINNTMFMPLMSNDYAFVYPMESADVYDASRNKRQMISACSDDGDGDCNTDDDSDDIIQLTVADSFAQSSPASRLYIASNAVSYCVRNNQVFRHTSALQTNQTLYTTGGVLMAENIANTLSVDPMTATAASDDPFRWYDMGLRRNAFTRILLVFSDNGQTISFMHEVHIPNVP